MATINLRVADLRKAKHLTQQELAEKIGVSSQSVSKWETENSLPDISLLPVLSEYFQVTVDQLLGLVPFCGETYIPDKTGTAPYWNGKFDYLWETRANFWNNDYLKFLVKDVWHIETPINILDCGCGFGCLGLELMPLLPQGSTYTGIDFSEHLIEQGKLLFSKNEINGKLLLQDVYTYQPVRKYDFVISQSVLRHLEQPEAFLQKMISFGKAGSYIICIDTNREFECDGLFIGGMDYSELCKHDGTSQKWKTEFEMQGRDYSIAMKTAHIMQKCGLKEIGVRMNDRVDFISPQMPDYEQLKQNFIAQNGWDKKTTKAEKEKVIRFFLSHGATRQDAEEYCSRNDKIADFFCGNPNACLSFFGGRMISYGKK